MATPFPFVSGNVLTAAQMNAITTLPINDQTASYTAVVGDVGKRIVMNVASANTLTINNSIFGVGDMIFVANKGAGVTTLTAGAGVTINPSGSLALAQYAGGTLVALSASVFIFFPSGGASKMKQVAAFTASGTWTVPAGVTYAVAHIRAAGGGAGSASSGAGGNSSVAFAGGTVSATGGGAWNSAFDLSAVAVAGAANSGNGASYQASLSGGFYSSSTRGAQNGAEIVAGGAVTPAASITITVGAGGTAGTNGAAGGTGYVYLEFEV